MAKELRDLGFPRIPEADVPLRSGMYFHKETAEDFPLLDLYETDDSLVLEVDLPGIDPEDVLIKVYDDLLIIEGIKRKTVEEKGFRYLCMERRFEGFRRTVKIPIPVNSTAGKASYSDGVVIVIFPKIKDRVIKIKVEK
ncbi:MAG TPA: Hsp20/alpha crystallin family protein [Thermodesulfovibrionales bacterium]|nr:Hsp20/alpha crystallin family protein [Thermodesulfovibrionales bacterium]